MKPLRNEGIFTPPSLERTLVVPANVGGAQWGGVVVDPPRQLAVVPVNRVAALVQLVPVEGTEMKQLRADGERIGDEITHMKGTPYVMRRRILRGPSGPPCTPPPWGSQVAIDLTTGAKKWEVPLGMLAALMPSGVSADPSWRSVNLGGAIVTAGGLVFVGASLDNSLRPYDVSTGRELWRASLPARARATSITYEVDGKQYVVAAAGGGRIWGKGDALVAFAAGE
ncbi:MAG TPA: PQQ-binding-like beta-propeller repeat protein [Limnochordia bacterium]